MVCRTAYYCPAECRLHDMGAGHPECPERLDAITTHFQVSGLAHSLLMCSAGDATEAQLERAHTTGYVAEISNQMQRAQQEGGHLAVDPDTAIGAGTALAARRAAGAAVAATDAVIRGEVANAFCAVRPPGHHATRDAAMGFCFFNNVAVAARHALDVHGLQRVAIVDFDVHHGNGTEDIIAGDERVLMVSFFQHPLYPYSGAVPRGTNMVNVPVAAHSRGTEVREAVAAMWLPALEAFRPQMLFISAGFDAHRDDGLGQLGLVEADYEWLTRQMVQVAQRHASGRIVSCLEGGYNLQALARSAAAHVQVLVRAGQAGRARTHG